MDAMNRVLDVISAGKISNNNTQYCYAVVFHDNVRVVASKNERSHSFKVTKEGDSHE